MTSNKTRAKNIQKMFNDISYRYDFLNRVISFRRDVVWRRRAVKSFCIQPGEKVLDLACGTGDMIITISGSQPKADIVGADFSLRMLIHGIRKVSAPLVCADACALPFADGSFDKITMAFGFRNVVDQPQALREMARVLKPGGRFCILEFSQPKSKFFSSLYWFYFKNVLPQVGRMVSKHESAYMYLPMSVERFPAEKDYRQMIADAGFTVDAMVPYDYRICTATFATKSA